MNTTDGPVMGIQGHLDYEKMMQYIGVLSERYDDLNVSYIGATILDKAIPVLNLGNPRASKSILYVGGVGGADGAVSAVLLRFVNEYFEFLKNGRRMYSVSLPYLFENRRICVVPMLNCDGCTIYRNGCGDSILRDRLLGMNGSEDFSEWYANARGVDLRRNFSAGFQVYKGEAAKKGVDIGGREGYCGTSPESEPETASLCNYIRMHNGTSMMLHLHMDDNRLTIPTFEEAEAIVPRSRTLARLLSHMSGTETERKSKPDATPVDWYITEYCRPAFALGCKYPDTDGSSDDYIKIYALIREVLFSAPLLV